MSDVIEVNVAGRLMLLLTRQGLLNNRSFSIYQCALSQALRKSLPATGVPVLNDEVERVLDEQLALLERAVRTRANTASAAVDGHAVVAAPAADAPTEPAAGGGSPRHAMRVPSGHAPAVKSMEEKLQDERKPIQTLLREDCVRVGLIDSNLAKRLIQGMTGKTGQQAEQDIVEHLRQTLQDQVKTFIRKAKGGPWADPRTQEDLRKDIHAARSVRSILMLARQVVKEYQVWQQENSRGGILGLFSPRKRLVQR